MNDTNAYVSTEFAEKLSKMKSLSNAGKKPCETGTCLGICFAKIS